MLIDLGWRGLFAQAAAALREDAGRALVGFGATIARLGARLAPHAPALLEQAACVRCGRGVDGAPRPPKGTGLFCSRECFDAFDTGRRT